MARWIWKFGEFEFYHNQQVHRKRQAYGYNEPAIWKIYRPEAVVEFTKEIDTEGGMIHIETCGVFAASLMDIPNEREPQWFGKSDIMLPPGRHILDIRVMNFDTFPALYVDGIVETDESWNVDDMTLQPQQAASDEWFAQREKRPDCFPFVYEPIKAISKEDIQGGALYDFGKETFARTCVSGLKSGESFRIQFGESREEALDPNWSVIHFDSNADEMGCKKYEAYAFRYIYISNSQAVLSAEYEYMPMKRTGMFKSSDSLMDQIWNTSAYTFHLNCREMILDGIKRDRWVWSADVYQSIFVNRYLFCDKKIEQRTLTALGGKKPFERHINTIMDYTFFWFMSLYEHYRTFGDKEFLLRLKPQMDEILNFCYNRTDSDGFVRGISGDWIFIDWADMDKTGAFCGEQILYVKALQAYAKICQILGEDAGEADKRAENLEQQIFEKFWMESKGAFIDSYESGKEKVTRQTNILAYLFLECTEIQKKEIYENVVMNDMVSPVTTPYFKFYENQVHCLEGNADYLDTLLREYYGGMLETGATSLYEEYNPSLSDAEHFAMYGRPYEKSLCHAWSASPVYFMGAFRLGVVNTGIAYEAYEVRPDLGTMESIEGKVPVPGGYIYVKADRKGVEVRSDIPGGTLVIGEKRYMILPKQKCYQEWDKS